VALREVHPGIDLIFYGNERQLEYDGVIAPGASSFSSTLIRRVASDRI
jgi:hypothetical protein